LCPALSGGTANKNSSFELFFHVWVAKPFACNWRGLAANAASAQALVLT
jgi:hypothetical protein